MLSLHLHLGWEYFHQKVQMKQCQSDLALVAIGVQWNECADSHPPEQQRNSHKSQSYSMPFVSTPIMYHLIILSKIDCWTKESRHFNSNQRQAQIFLSHIFRVHNSHMLAWNRIAVRWKSVLTTSKVTHTICLMQTHWVRNSANAPTAKQIASQL